jgi:UV DNA damage endonuclease
VNPDQLGYACLNTTLRNESPSIYTGRVLSASRFTLERASRLALANVKDLYEILRWNESHGIGVFRIGSDVFPRREETFYDLNRLPDIEEILFHLRRAGNFAARHGHRLSMHPSQQVALASTSTATVSNSLRTIESHSLFLDLLNPELRTIINIHVGGTYGDDFAAVGERFADIFLRLSPAARGRLVLENDDRSAGWSVSKLHQHIYPLTEIPITYDYHHSRFSKEENISFEEEYTLAKSTWKTLPNEVHYSESAGPGGHANRHSNYYGEPMPSFLMEDQDNYIILESKMKEMSLLRYREQFSG